MDYYDMEDELSAADLKEFIKRMVGELPPRQQEVFKMSRDEYLTYKEIATRLNISEKTVERHINEAIKFLKKNIMLYLILSLNNHSLFFLAKMYPCIGGMSFWRVFIVSTGEIYG